MSRLVVFATVMSRLHADLVIVRLKQAGIPTSLISALYSPAAKPNSGVCWLAGEAQLPLSSGEHVEISGPLSAALSGDETPGHRSLHHRLGRVGLTAEQSADIEESLRQNRPVVAIEASEENALISVFQILHGLGADKIMPIVASSKSAKSPATPPRYRPAPARAAPGLGSFAATA